MKKNMFLAIILLSIISVCSSCKDDDKDKGLEGTTWKCIIDDDDWACTIKFVDQSSFSWTETEGGSTRPYSGTYSYSNPRIILNIHGDWIMTGTVTGNKIILIEEDEEYSYTYTFTKQ